MSDRLATPDWDDLLKRLDWAGGVGADLSPGDPLAAEAAALLRQLQKWLAQYPPKTREEFMALPLKHAAYDRGAYSPPRYLTPPAAPYDPDTVTWGNGFVLGYDSEGFFRRPI